MELVRTLIDYKVDGLRFPLIIWSVNGQPDRKHGALARITLNADISAQHPAKFFADCQAQTGASVFPRGGIISLGECFKDVFKLIG